MMSSVSRALPLHARTRVVFEVLLDLRLASPFGGFVDGQLNLAAPVLHHLGH
jgi:hypothetical protein